MTAVAPGGTVELTDDRCRVSAITAQHDRHRARVVFDAALPDLIALADGAAEEGRWHVEVDGVRLTGGTWDAVRARDRVELALDVDERWRPRSLPWLMRLMTTAVPAFRRWPTTYRWRAQVRLQPTSTMTSRWERTASDAGQSYRRATGS